MISAPSITEVEGNLARIQDYWQRLRRGENSIPFSDDIRLASLSSMAQDVLLIEVFDDPMRFRIDIAGARVEKQYGAPLAGKFVDEVAPRGPLDGLSAQCRAVVEARTPGYETRKASKQPLARLVLPFWGDGHVAMLLVAIAYLNTEPART
jgi:hypothetical protein